jgi:antitoxin VapB
MALQPPPGDAKTAKLFRNGASQAVRLPAEFRFEGSEVYIWRDERHGTVVLSPRPRTTWDDLLAAQSRLTDEDRAGLLHDRQQPAAQQRILSAPPDPHR